MDKGYNEKQYYECKYCYVVMDSIEAMEDHLKECKLNRTCNKNCLTCSKYEYHKFAPKAENANGYLDQYATLLVGGTKFNKLYCTDKQRYLVNDDFLTEYDCYDAWDGESVCETVDKGYNAHWEQVEKDLQKHIDEKNVDK